MVGNVGKAFARIEKRKNKKFRKKLKEEQKKYYKKNKLELLEKSAEYRAELSKFTNRRCRLCNELLSPMTKGDYCIKHYNHKPKNYTKKYEISKDKPKDKPKEKVQMKQKKKLNIGLLYISLHNLLKRRIGVNRYISRKDFYTILGKHFLIPKNIRIVVIKEMEDRGLVKQESKENIKILDCELDMKNNINNWYRKVGIFSVF